MMNRMPIKLCGQPNALHSDSVSSKYIVTLVYWWMSIDEWGRVDSVASIVTE